MSLHTCRGEPQGGSIVARADARARTGGYIHQSCYVALLHNLDSALLFVSEQSAETRCVLESKDQTAPGPANTRPMICRIWHCQSCNSKFEIPQFDTRSKRNAGGG